MTEGLNSVRPVGEPKPDRGRPSGDIPTLTRVMAAEDTPSGPAPGASPPPGATEADELMIDELVAEYLPRLERELRRRLREQLLATRS